MWKHREEAEEQISLHDCRVTHIITEEDRILMGFADGFWLIQKTAYNPAENTLKTTRSQLVFHLDPQYADEAEIAVFRQKQLRGKKWVAVREYRDLKWLMTMINQHGAQMEIIDEYGRYGNRLYRCILRMKKPAYRVECEVELPTIRRIEYCWNEIDPERIW